GIGKTSLSIYLASVLASKYLEGLNNIFENYIPILVTLKGKSEFIDENDTDLEDKLEEITSGESGGNKKIVLICDGLNEYGLGLENLKIKFDKLRGEDKYPNMRFILITRPEAEIPSNFSNIHSYIRLLPF